MNNVHALYIHIPFCTNKCFYCDFNSYVLQGQPVMDYLKALRTEMEAAVRALPPVRIDTIFVGGGTPTVLNPDQMAFFLDSVRSVFPFDPDAVEFTMEANPGTTDRDKLAVMKEGGVNRISFGVQSFNNRLLERIGRIHNADDVYRSLELAREAGFRNLSIDLMFGLPDQTEDALRHSLDEALKLDLEHYSIYGLKVEENTLFHKLYQRGELPLPEEDAEIAMYRLIMDTLRSHGYIQYEISNFARPGYESKHNATYWRNEPYYGIGAGAHGYAQRVRHVNVKGIQQYIEAAGSAGGDDHWLGFPRSEIHQVSREEAMEDFMMVGLRLLEGVRGERFMEQFGSRIEDVFGEPIRKLIAHGLLEPADDGYRLTADGLLLGNEVFGEFIGVIA